MSCLGALILPWIAAISGRSVERLAQMVDAARRQPLPPLPLDPAVVDAVLAGLPAGHDPKQGAAVLRAVAQGLRLALRQSRGHPPAARDVALLAALTGTVLPDVPPPDPQLVQAMRADLWLRPAPLPLTLPDAPDARRRAVGAAARVIPWTDDEAERIASAPALAGLAWALGVRHPRICAVVDESIEAAAAALSAGSTDPSLLQRVAEAEHPTWSAEVLAASDLADSALIARAAETTETAVRVLAARPDLTDPALIAAATREPWAAAQVLEARQDLTTPDLIARAAEWAAAAARVLTARQDLTAPALIARAAEWAETAAEVLAARSDITDPALIARAAETTETAVRVLAKRPDIAAPALIAAAARKPWSAAEVLAKRPDIAAPALIAAATQYPHTATKVLAARPDLRSQRDVLDRVGQHRAVAYAVVDVLGPYPALWNALPVEVRNEMADHYQMTPSERAWIESIATRTPPVWTEADEQMAARFPWHAALRDSLRTEAMD